MVTHDVDEAMFLSHRNIVMANGLWAAAPEVVVVDLDRPRDKRAMVVVPAYAEPKNHLLSLLAESLPATMA